MNVSDDPVAKILVVDDHQANLTAVEAVLEPLGQPMVMAHSGDEALERLLEDEFAVVLLDVMMPGMTGFDVARMMRERKRTANVPIIFLTARDPQQPDVMQGYLHRAADYIIKPFDPDVLRAKVSVFVELHKAREAARQLARQDERRVQAERERERFHELLMHAPVAVAVLAGPQQAVELVNERFRALFKHDVVSGRPLVQVFPELERSSLADLLSDVYAQGQPFAASELAVTLERDGERRQTYFDLSVEPLRDGDGTLRLLASAVDVTEHVEARRVREDFLSIASHELKTPLTTLRLQADRLQRVLDQRKLTAEVVAPKVDVVRRQIARLERLVNELLDVSRIAAGKLPVVVEDVDLADVARDVVDRCRDELHAARNEITFNAAAPVMGRWDRTRVDQVVTNLLTNAIKYGRGRPIEVTVDASSDGRARLRVQDHGIGIAAENQSRIFDRFERAVSERNFGGLGLGLWIVARIVAECGGEVGVESALDQGSTFTVTLPRQMPG